MAATQGAMGVGLSVTRGYASGTTDAAPGFAMVGENGPELVFFQGGEQVVNATQTAAMQRQSALSADPAKRRLPYRKSQGLFPRSQDRRNRQVKIHTTSQGDMWDMIAYKALGNINLTNKLMMANRQYLGLYTFPAGIVLTLLEVGNESSVEGLPPWKR